MKSVSMLGSSSFVKIFVDGFMKDGEYTGDPSNVLCRGTRKLQCNCSFFMLLLYIYLLMGYPSVIVMYNWLY